MDDRPGRISWLGPRLVAAALIGLGVLLVVQALGITQSGGYRVIGPETFALVVAVGIVVLGILAAVRTTIVPDVDLATRAADEEAITHWPTTVRLAGLLVLYAIALGGADVGPLELPGLGYVVATGLFLPAAAWVLGSRHLVRDLVIGLGVAIVIFFGFTEFLGVRLPAGILEPLL